MMNKGHGSLEYLLMVVVALIIVAIAVGYLRSLATTTGSTILEFNLSDSSTPSEPPTHGMQQKICREQPGVRFIKSHEELMGAMDCSNPINETTIDKLSWRITHHNVPKGTITVINSDMYVKEDGEFKWEIKELELWSNAAEIEIDGQIVAALYFSGDGKVGNYVGHIRHEANGIYVVVTSDSMHLSKGWHKLVIRFQTHSGNYIGFYYYYHGFYYYYHGKECWYQHNVGQNYESAPITFYTRTSR